MTPVVKRFSRGFPAMTLTALLGLGGMCGLWTMAARAQEASASLTEREFLAELPIVLSVSRLAQPLNEAPAAISVIDREMIKASGFRNVPDLLRLVPGFLVAYSGGDRAFTAYHGMSDNFQRQLQVLVDGRSVYTELFGGVDWSSLPLLIGDIDRIEVIRGPNAAVYGANSFFGVINIITRLASQDQGVSVALTKGNFGQVGGIVSQASQVGGVHYRVNLDYRKDQGFRNIPNSSRIKTVTLRGDAQPSNADALSMQLGLTQADQEYGEFGALTNPPRPRITDTGFVQLHWQRNLSPSEQFSLLAYHTFQRDKEWFSVRLPAPIPKLTGISELAVDLDKRATRNNLELQHTLAPHADLRAIWGMELREDRVNSSRYFSTPDDQVVRLWRLFGNAEWRAASQWLIHLGAMAEEDTLSGFHVSPRLAVNWLLAPQHTLRAGISRGYRTPVPFEQKANTKFTLGSLLLDQQYLSQGGLKAESINSVELGYLANLADPKLFLDVRLFRDDLRDLIGITRVALAPNPSSLDRDGAGSFINNNRATLRGVEAQLKYLLPTDAQLNLAYAYSRVSATDVGAPLSLSVPKHNASLLVAQPLPGNFAVSMGYYRVTKLTWLGEGDSVPGYSRLDLGLTRSFRLANGAHGDISVMFQNILGDYADFQIDNRFERRAFVKLGVNL